MKTFVVGDVHGCLSELQSLVKELHLQKGDRLVMVGDLVAKGPDSQGVVQYLRELQAISVRGNHDEAVLRFRRGEPTRKHHEQVAKTLTEADWGYLQRMPTWLDLPELDTLIVHAGLVPGIAVEKQSPEDLITMRSIDDDGRASKRVDAGLPWASRWQGPRHVVFGHDAIRGLQQWPKATGLDTGCVYGRRLTALVLPEKRLVSVPSRQIWNGGNGD